MTENGGSESPGMTPATTLERQAGPAPDRSDGGRPVILVAENDPHHRFVLRRVFRTLPFDGELRFVLDGQELIDYLMRQGDFREELVPAVETPWPHMVLIDLHMPRLNGMEALERMRHEPSLRSLPVVMFSSSDQPHHVDQAYAAGANAYLVKVGDTKQLVSHLRGLAAFWLYAAKLPRQPSRAPGSGYGGSSAARQEPPRGNA
ncbi:response regulator [Rhizosaccharibacter radicis]|uniref:Response regulator n=1 Tax=Rhizosaccharibacter radicis TaxID=2782605 RepID=A0ABT1VVI5_9PROT|nr:response regulator [Acetobacteraceae bacterium KSS12]